MAGEQKPTTKEPIGKTLSKWILWRAAATIFWIYIIWHPAIHPVLPKEWQAYAISSEYAYARWCVLAVASLLIIGLFRWRGFGYVLYVLIAYPLVVFWAVLIYWISKLLRGTYRKATSLIAPAAAVITFIVTAIGWLFIPRMTSTISLNYIAYPWAFVAVISLLGLCTLTLNPLKPALLLLKGIANTWVGYIQKDLFDPFKKSTGPNRESSLPNLRNNIGWLEGAVKYCESNILPKLDRPASNRFSLIVFFAVYSWLVVSLIMDFAIGYLILAKVQPGAIRADSGIALTLPEAIYLSISTVATAGVSEFKHVSGAAKCLCAGEVLSGFVLLSLLLAGFSLSIDREWADLKENTLLTLHECKSKIALWRADMEPPTPPQIQGSPQSSQPTT